MNYDFECYKPHGKLSIEYATKFDSIGVVKLDQQYELQSANLCGRDRVVAYRFPNVKPNPDGGFSFPQLSLRCFASEIYKMGHKNTIQWIVGGEILFEQNFDLVKLLNRLRKDLPLLQMRRFMFSVSLLLRKSGMHDLVAKQVVLYSILQQPLWAPYVWLLCPKSHDLQYIERFYHINYLIPLCLPMARDRWLAPYHEVKLHLRGLPMSPEFCYNDGCGPKIVFQHDPSVEIGVDVKNRLFHDFAIAAQSESLVKHCGKTLKLGIRVGHVGHVLLVHIKGPNTRIDRFSVTFEYGKNALLKTFSGPLKSLCQGWLVATTDDSIDFSNTITQKIPMTKRFLNLEVAVVPQITFSNSENLDLVFVEQNEIIVYWQFENVLIDHQGVCGKLY